MKSVCFFVIWVMDFYDFYHNLCGLKVLLLLDKLIAAAMSKNTRDIPFGLMGSELNDKKGWGKWAKNWGGY